MILQVVFGDELLVCGLIHLDSGYKSHKQTRSRRFFFLNTRSRRYKMLVANSFCIHCSEKLKKNKLLLHDFLLYRLTNTMLLV